MIALIRNLLIISGAVLWICIGAVLYVIFNLPLPNSIERVLDPVAERVEEEVSPSMIDEATGPDAETFEEAPTSTGDEVAPTPAQASALRALGVDPSAVREVSPQQEACFVRSLGQERVDAIKGGAVPMPIDLMKARECL